MKFGIFDQNDRCGLPLEKQYKNRFELAELYDRSGFHCYHMSEHHSTPLSMTPSPSVWMSALSQRTTRLRLCPLVYLLPLYNPVRLFEEICILDHLSGGRFEFGIGRGVSPYELDALGADFGKAAEMYREAFEVIQRCFTEECINFSGDFWQFKDYVVEMKPLQRPMPPLWYAVGSPESTIWPARNRVNIVCGGPASRVRTMTDRYREEASKAGLGGPHEPLLGAMRFVVIAGSENEARQIGKNAWATFYDSFMKLWRKHGKEPIVNFGASFDLLIESGHAAVGTAKSVAQQLDAQISQGGLNYLIGSFMFGNMQHADALASVRAFAADVMPLLCSDARTPA